MRKAWKWNKNMPHVICWWGYLHANGSIQLKRWLGDHAEYTTDCEGNPFVKKVVEPFEANTREEAMEIITNILKGEL